MMRGNLVFRPTSLPELERVLGAVATALGAPPHPWVTESYSPLPDASGEGRAFTQVSTRPGARFVRTVSCVYGNPREGWDYDGQLDLEVGPRESPENRGRIPVAEEERPTKSGASRGYPGSAEGFSAGSGENRGPRESPENRGRIPVAEEERPTKSGGSRGYLGSAEGFSAGSGENRGPCHLEARWSYGQQSLPNELTLTTSELDDATFLAVKAAFAGAVPPGSDRTDQAFTALANLRASTQPEVRAALLASALAYGASTGDRGAGWDELLRMGAAAGAVGALQRIRETPGDPEGWAHAPPELAEVAAHMRARLSPWEGEGVWAAHAPAWAEAVGGPRRVEGWLVHEDGLGPSEGTRVRELELFRDLGPPGTWPYGFYGDVFRVAAFVAGSSLPRTHVGLQKRDVTWRWFGGPAPEDVAVVRTERVGVLQLPMEVWIGGSEAWKVHGRRALEGCTPFRWVAPPVERERAPRGIEAGPEGLEGALELARDWPELQENLRANRWVVPPVTGPPGRRLYLLEIAKCAQAGAQGDADELARGRKLRAMMVWAKDGEEQGG